MFAEEMQWESHDVEIIPMNTSDEGTTDPLYSITTSFISENQ